MGFILIHNGRQLGSENIKWKFAGRDGEFESMPERLERNIAFWRKKIGTTAEVEYLNVKLENEETYVESIPADNADIVSDSIVDAQPSVSEVVENSVDTPKRKSRKKTTNV